MAVGLRAAHTCQEQRRLGRLACQICEGSDVPSSQEAMGAVLAAQHSESTT